MKKPHSSHYQKSLWGFILCLMLVPISAYCQTDTKQDSSSQMYNDKYANFESFDTPLNISFRHGIGFTLGYGSPYGFGIEYNYLLHPRLDVNVGGGLSLSGTRLGFGFRHYLKGQTSGFYLQSNFIYTTGVSALVTTVDEIQGIYSIPSDYGLFFSGGYNIKILDIMHLMVGGGYGIPLQNNPITRQSSIEDVALNKVVNSFKLGGLILNTALIIRFN